MRFHISMIPQEIIDEYNLTNIMEADGWCYVEIQKAMYGLKESRFIGRVPSHGGFFECGTQRAIASRQGKFFEIIKNRNGKLSHHHQNGNVLNQTSMDIYLFNTNL